MNEVTKKIIISGGDSWVNRGDKAILTGSIKILEKIPNIEIYILSGDPKTSKLNFPNQKIVNRNNLFELITAVKKSDLFLWGGGHLLQNTSSKLFLVYQFFLLFIPILFNKKIMGFALGVERINGKFWQYLSKLFLSQFSLISVRDELSNKILNELGIETPIHVTADPAVVLEPSTISMNNSKNKPEKKYAIIAPRKWFHYKSKILPVKWQTKYRKDLDDGFLVYLLIFAKLADYIIEKFSLDIYFLPMYPGSEQGDEEISKQIICLMKNKKSAKIFDSNIDSIHLIDFIRNSSFLIGMRMHATILAICANTPAIAIYYQNKGKSFFESMELDSYAFPIDKLEEKIILAKIDDLISHQIAVKGKIKYNLEILQKRAFTNIALINQLINN